MKFFKYQGAGNDFLIADNRRGKITLSDKQIQSLCDRHYGLGADGVMLLENAPEPYSFRMRYFNSDGSGGMMCGNGGRCIAAFANSLGLKVDIFIADDGEHQAVILAKNGCQTTVRLKMKDVDGIDGFSYKGMDGSFLDTGTRHLVVPVDCIDTIDVYNLGKELRNLAIFAPIGTNVNFVQQKDGVLNVRTYEKGVEDETLACGTGIVASAIAYWHAQSQNGQASTNGIAVIPIKAKKDELSVSFSPTASGAKEIWLTGPATFVAKALIPE